MTNLKSVLVLGLPSANEKGDLFAASMKGLFTVLGYQDFRLNIHKTGREIDIEAVHSTENKRLVAECKATAKAIGGTDVNTLMGKVSVEQLKDPSIPIQAYFVSLSGFTEPAIEQEKEAAKRVALLDSEKIVEILVKSRILIDPVAAAEMSGRFTKGDPDLRLHEDCHLIISSLGSLWLFYYTRHKEIIGFSLIHGGGTPISSRNLLKFAALERIS